jgi:uncharacterized NAD-dependent epimerase/dehydratase family protein
MPSLEEVIDLTLSIGRVVNPAIRCVGISINTHQLSQAESERATQEAADRLSLPATDPMKFGVRVITDYLMKQQ